MKTVDLMYAIIIILVFLFMFAYSITIAGAKNIKDNWAEYKCNPVYMGFSQNIVGVSPQKNLTDCIQSMQSNYMSYLLEPIQYSLDVVGVLISSIVGTMNDLQDFTSDFTGSQNSMFSSAFGSLGDMVGSTTSMTEKIIDMLAKTSAITTILQYLGEGMVMTAESLTATLTGSSSCFHPDTMVKLQNGKVVPMKEIYLGDILENGSVVEATMQISNLDAGNNIKERFYTIWNNDLNMHIYVTGSHLVKDKATNKFVRVEHSSQATKTQHFTPILSCLITHDHRIRLGDQEFWDWEDDN